MNEEKRRERRLPFRGCVVRLPGRGGSEHEVLDLSIDGLQMGSGEPMAPGEVLPLEIRTPQFSRPIEIEGRVAWCRGAGDRPGHRIGVEFAVVSRKALEQLEQLKDEGLHRQLNPKIP